MPHASHLLSSQFDATRATTMRPCCTFVLVSHSADDVYRLNFHHDRRLSLRPHDRRRSEVCRQPGCCHVLTLSTCTSKT